MTKRTKYSRELQCSYLYSDGSLLQWFNETRDGEKIGETVEVTRGWCEVVVNQYRSTFNTSGPNPGRIVLGRYDAPAMIALAKGNKVVATVPCIEAGSENSKRANVTVGHLVVKTRQFGEFTWMVLGSMLSSPFTIQMGEDHAAPAEWVVGQSWAGMRIVKVTDLRPKTPAFMLDRSEVA